MRSPRQTSNLEWDRCRLPRRAVRDGMHLLIIFEDLAIRVGGRPGYTVEHRDPNQQTWVTATDREETITATILQSMRREISLLRRGRTCEEPDGQMLWPSLLFPALKRCPHGDLDALRYFWATPQETWRLVDKFSSAAIMPLLRLLARFPEAAQLVRHNPGLAVLLATKAASWSPDELRGQIRRKQVALGAELGCAPGIVRLLARLDRNLCNRRNIKILQHAWHDPRLARLLPHMKLNFALFILLDDPDFRPQSNSRLLLELSRANHNQLCNFIQAWDHPLRALFRLGLGSDHPLESMNAFYQWQHRMQFLPAKPRLPLPPPPLPGQPGIEPITDSRGLIDEGRDQTNCAGTLDVQRQVIEGGIFLYRVLHPERATLCLRQDWPENRWVIAQIRSTGNKPASPDLRGFVERWLAENSTVGATSAA